MKAAAQKTFFFVHPGITLFQKKHIAKTATIFLFLLTALLGAITLASVALPFMAVKKGVQLFSFLIAGLYYTRIFSRQQAADSSASFRWPLFWTLIVATVLFGIYYFLNKQLLIMVLGNSSAFLLPFIFYKTWGSYAEIPQPQTEFPVWYIPPADTSKPATVFLNGMPVRIKMPLNGTEDKELFATAAPQEMALGDFFSHFLLQKMKNKNLHLQLENEQQQPFGWKFYTEDLGGLMKRQLDPEQSLAANKIKEQMTIIVEKFTEYDEDMND